MEPRTNGMPHHRTIVVLDIERSTGRPDSVKADLRKKLYDLFDAALRSSGIEKRYRDPFIDRGDGILALIRPVDQTPKALLLNHMIPALNQLLIDHNTSLPRSSQLRVRMVLHAGEVRYDAYGCFGEALDVAIRLLDADQVKKALQVTAGSLTVVVSDDIYRTVVRHCCGSADQQNFHKFVKVQIVGNRYTGWIYSPEQSLRRHVTELGQLQIAGLTFSRPRRRDVGARLIAGVTRSPRSSTFAAMRVVRLFATVRPEEAPNRSRTIRLNWRWRHWLRFTRQRIYTNA